MLEVMLGLLHMQQAQACTSLTCQCGAQGKEDFCLLWECWVLYGLDDFKVVEGWKSAKILFPEHTLIRRCLHNGLSGEGHSSALHWLELNAREAVGCDVCAGDGEARE